jgi:hypothetical protein
MFDPKVGTVRFLRQVGEGLHAVDADVTVTFLGEPEVFDLRLCRVHVHSGNVDGGVSHDVRRSYEHS